MTAAMEGFEPKEQPLVVSRDTSSEIILKLDRVKPTPSRDPLQPLLDELKKAEAANDWGNVSRGILTTAWPIDEPGRTGF